MESELDKWLISKDYFTRTVETPVPSHLLYNGYKGGKIYLPRSKEYEFLCQYANELSKRTKLYYVETRPRTFKFMIDIDISDNHYWSVEEISKLTMIIQKTVYAFFETNQVVVCCISPIKIKNDEIHTGIHLIWPNLFIMSDTALCIRRGIIQKLKESVFKLSKTWEDIIDETIYTRNGYRMIGSDKISTMKTPKDSGSKKKVKVPENRPLDLLFVMDSYPDYLLNENYYNRLRKDTKALVLETSIRYVIDACLDQGMCINKFPLWLEDDILQRKAPNRGIGGTVASGKDHLIIEEFIHKKLPSVYSNQIVKAVTRYPDGNLLIKTNSRFCMNLGREHNSCGIYFFACPDGIYQKCLCPCNKLDGRKNGLCMDYSSECFPFNEDTRKLLFPGLSENMFVKLKNKKKEDSKYVPGTKENTLSQLEKVVDIMFEKIMSL